jgi:hypothetical protein
VQKERRMELLCYERYDLGLDVLLISLPAEADSFIG